MIVSDLNNNNVIIRYIMLIVLDIRVIPDHDAPCKDASGSQAHLFELPQINKNELEMHVWSH